MENTAKTRILVVEDDQNVLSTIAMMLNLKGYEVETAYDGFDALVRLKDNIPKSSFESFLGSSMCVLSKDIFGVVGDYT